MSVMSNQNDSNNGVNRAGTLCEGPSPGRCSLAQQQGPGHHQTVADRNIRSIFHLLGMKKNRKKNNIPWWRRRLETKSEHQ